MNYDFKINQFEGPLDLLLHLIKINEMDIMDIQIEEITKQYVEYIRLQEKLNIEEDEEEIDPREELIQSLLEYEAYKKLSHLLEEKGENRSLIYTKLPENINNFAEDVDISNEGEIDDLINAFKLFLDRKSKSKPLKTRVTVKEISVSSRCLEIRSILKKSKKVSFFDLFSVDSKEYVVATFLAILEMCKNKELIIKQDNNFSDIIVESVK